MKDSNINSSELIYSYFFNDVTNDVILTKSLHLFGF